MTQNPHVRVLVLDATPLITHSYSHYQNYAELFYTTPTVFSEIRNEQARKNLEIWQGLGTLNLRHPKQESVKRIIEFSRLTGDYSVLSTNDIHILALAYELETELNKGDWRLRSKPGESLTKLKESESSNLIKKKKSRRGGKKQRAKRNAAIDNNMTDKTEPNCFKSSFESNTYDSNKLHDQLHSSSVLGDEPSIEEINEIQKLMEETCLDNTVPLINESRSMELSEDYLEADDDGDWITPDNLIEAITKDNGEDTVVNEDNINSEIKNSLGVLNLPQNQVALVTGDFAVQNVALQLNLNLMNFTSGLKIKRLRNYMLRCHACFRLFPIPRDGKIKHFCSSCGGYSTLIRCAVSVDSETGEVTPHLKANFQWNNRGNRYSLSSPLSKNSQKKFGKKGFDHTRHPQEVIILREDQKEYQQAIKQEEWTKNHNEKVLSNWISGGSADNCISPFAISGLKHHSVQIGRGRYVNSNKKR